MPHVFGPGWKADNGASMHSTDLFLFSKQVCLDWRNKVQEPLSAAWLKVRIQCMLLCNLLRGKGRCSCSCDMSHVEFRNICLWPMASGLEPVAYGLQPMATAHGLWLLSPWPLSHRPSGLLPLAVCPSPLARASDP